MPSVLAWLDHDEAERRRMQEVIELFRERDTVDELGIGSVRDAFSNLLFPGTSVLHSRARYLLFVPWVYLELERQHISSAEIAARARRDEIRLIDALINGGEGEGNGVIGAVARDRLKQLPSYAYWNGLEALGIRLYQGSTDRYHRSLDGYYQLLRDLPRAEGDEPIDAPRANWDPGLPSPPDRMLESATLRAHSRRGAVPPRANPRLGTRVVARLVRQPRPANTACPLRMESPRRREAPEGSCEDTGVRPRVLGGDARREPSLQPDARRGSHR